LKNGQERQASGAAAARADKKASGEDEAWRRGPRLQDDLERLGAQVVDAAYTVHRALGPGLLESVYEACLARELANRGLAVRAQVPMPVVYDGVRFDAGFRLDILVEERIVVEVKSVETLLGVHIAQLRTYLKLAGLPLGFLVNFNVALFGNGIRRVTAGVGAKG
jgi:GxxExxY protein